MSASSIDPVASTFSSEEGIVPQILPEGIDTFSIVLFVIAASSAIYQVIYILAPYRLKKMFEFYDYDESLLE